MADLFRASTVPPSDASAPLRVSELTGRIRQALEARFSDVWVEGEISNFRGYRSGHYYFTLKDADAQLRCVLFRGYASYVFFEPRDGLLVRACGDVSVYEPRGDLQLVVRSMRLAGEGALQKAFEELKRSLQSEGLFDPSRKRRLPSFPETIGIITSGDGAALHDMLSILKRRFPLVQVLVCPVRVQGMGAAEEIAEALAAFNALPSDDPLRPDVLIVGRGGGSAEDLWAFNEEVLARAIYDSAIPVVSAVGHETDVSISDFVADIRAATPSMAAELVVPDRHDVEAMVRGLYDSLHNRVRVYLDRHRRRVEALTSSYGFQRPVEYVRHQRRYLESLQGRMHRAVRINVQQHQHRIEALQQRLSLLDPARPMQLGYVRVERDGALIRRACDVEFGDRLTLHFADGTRNVQVKD